MTHVFTNLEMKRIQIKPSFEESGAELADHSSCKCCSSSWNAVACLLFFIALALLSASHDYSAEDGWPLALLACVLFIVVIALSFYAPSEESGNYCEKTTCSCRLKPFATASAIFGVGSFISMLSMVTSTN